MVCVSVHKSQNNARTWEMSKKESQEKDRTHQKAHTNPAKLYKFGPEKGNTELFKTVELT